MLSNSDHHKGAVCPGLRNRMGFPVAAIAPDAPCMKPSGGLNESFRTCAWLVAGLMLLPALGGCGGPVAAPAVPSPQEHSITKMPALGIREKQAAFLNQIRSADPDARTIDRALINEQNELGLILDRTVELEKIPGLMRLMLTKMAAQFPGEDLTVIAYTPSNPPRKVGTARLDTRTRDMSYTPE